MCRRPRTRSGSSSQRAAPARRQCGYSRASQEPTFGAAYMIHRRHNGEDWVACEPTEKGHEPDSRVHRYNREIGFALAAGEQEMVDRNQAVADAEQRSPPCTPQTSCTET